MNDIINSYMEENAVFDLFQSPELIPYRKKRLEADCDILPLFEFENTKGWIRHSIVDNILNEFDIELKNNLKEIQKNKFGCYLDEYFITIAIKERN